MNSKQALQRSKKRIEHRLRVWSPQDERVLAAQNIHYEVSARDRAITNGGIGAMQLRVQRLELPAVINEHPQLLKVHLPYSDSDHGLRTGRWPWH
ncbi:MAG: hypothetical protein IPK26_12495 [Planctomycetes bacterium]|nr:hypothetical protein [Planctomycetota bacterium]